MKALTFTEYYEGICNDGSQSINDIIEKSSAYLKFLNQDFSTEMITELFENFRFIRGGGFDYKREINIFFKKNYYVFEIIKSEFTYDSLAFPKIPQTLNEFISDCKRLGIELEFKQ